MGGDGSGRGGLTPQKVKRCERLLGEGKTRVQIARVLGLGLTTVRRIELGEHFLQLARDVAAYQRCPGCGALIETAECLLCELRKAGL
ncbi:MAG: hypothetical protein H0T51_07760 [Pirellulales bacterium]|nr:hypothetical protein [Pirellulales bacterium]